MAQIRLCSKDRRTCLTAAVNGAAAKSRATGEHRFAAQNAVRNTTESKRGAAPGAHTAITYYVVTILHANTAERFMRG